MTMFFAEIKSIKKLAPELVDLSALFLLLKERHIFQGKAESDDSEHV